jgi:FkbM family methyltransferase
VDEQRDVYNIRLRGVATRLVWPKSVGLVWLYAVLAEQSSSKDWHFYETPETKVQQGDTVVDCGAAEGLFSLLVADRAAHVHAIEPLPLWVECMRQTFESLPNVEVLPCALSNETGTATLQGNGICSRLDSEGCFVVPVETIDNLFLKRGIRVDFLKADLEGHDLKMLHGASETIYTHAPRIAITTYHEKTHADAMMKYLRRINRSYQFKVKGIDAAEGGPVMLHAWT